jgi:hypothetical protein
MTPSAGRPEIGTPINTRLSDELLAEVDAYAESEGLTRAAAIRLLIRFGLNYEGDNRWRAAKADLDSRPSVKTSDLNDE